MKNNIESLLDSLSKIKFRGSFHLNKKMKDYGKQTLMKQVHPVFIAQHVNVLLISNFCEKNIKLSPKNVKNVTKSSPIFVKKTVF